MGSMLFTQDGSSVEVEQVWVVSARQDEQGQWIQMGGRVALMPNGAYCHGDGNLLPFKSEEEIRQIFTSRDREGNPCILPEMQGLMELVLEWFSHRADFNGSVVQKVVLNRKGWPELEDGTPAEMKDVYAWYEPGEALEAAICGFYARRRFENETARAAKPDIYRQTPAPPPGQTKVAGDLVAKPQPRGVKRSGKASTKGKTAKGPAKAAANSTAVKPSEAAAAV